MTPEGKRIPLDTVAPVYTVVVADQDDNPDTCVRNRASYVSHFATCPKASQFSASKKADHAGAGEHARPPREGQTK